MRTLSWFSAITIAGAVSVAGCEIGGDAWPSSRGSGDGGAAPLQATSSTGAARPSVTSVGSTSTIAGSTAMTTATGGPVPVPGTADE